jgi:hypothetical protein
MKYSLKNEYKELLNEEVVSILRKSNSFEDELWDVEFDQEGEGIKAAYKKTDMPQLLKTLLEIKPNYANVSDAKIVAHYLENEKDANNIYRVDFTEFTDDDILTHLNTHFKDLAKYTKDKIGKGELSFHLAFNTENWNTGVEPDAVWGKKHVSIKSVEDQVRRARGAAKTGESAETGVIKAILYDGDNSLFRLLSIGSGSSTIDATKLTFINKIQKLSDIEKVNKVINCIKNLQNEIFTEHDNNFLLIWTGYKFVKCKSAEQIGIQSVKNGRINFVYKEAFTADPRSAIGMPDNVISQEELDKKFEEEYRFIRGEMPAEDFAAIRRVMKTPNTKRRFNNDDFKVVRKFYDAVLEKPEGQKAHIKRITTLADISAALDSEKAYLENEIMKDKVELVPFSGDFVDILHCAEAHLASLQNTSLPAENSSYAPQGKVLKEIYSHLFKKKLISEGGLAGHMMHPYEALDMTPRQIIDRIKEYSTSQKIIEKVDGQNLFFTVEQDGTLMFARNKEDMTHNDLVEKFTNHPAEVPFVTGGNAIKKGVDQWLSSAGEFGQQEILDIFHPDGEARSFINFEIMHKDHPNQLEYGENFIVLHSIIDFVDGREAVYSSNNSQRLDKLINLIKQGVESLGYTLASNRTVDLNKLTNVQVSHYANRIKEVASQLDITEDEFLGDGVEKQIKKQLDSEGINISDEAIKMLYDFALYGEDKSGNNIKSKDFTSLMQPEDVKKLRSINLTSANKAAAKVRRILSPFKEIFVDLGIDLLDSVPSSYMNSETDLANINSLRDKLETAIDDLSFYMDNTPESDWDSVVNRLKPHYDKVIEVGIENTVSTSVEGGVYDYQGDLLKVTGGFAPLNQILGAAYRDKKGIFPTFKQKFMKQESNRRSLKSVFNLVY